MNFIDKNDWFQRNSQGAYESFYHITGKAIMIVKDDQPGGGQDLRYHFGYDASWGKEDVISAMQTAWDNRNGETVFQEYPVAIIEDIFRGT